MKKQAGRRDNGDGTIVQRADGRWMSQLVLPDGTRKTFYGVTKIVAKAKLDAARKEVKEGVDLKAQGQTVGDFLNGWLAIVKHRTKIRTHETYASYMRLHTTAITAIPLGKLTPQQVQDLYTAKMDSGLSRTTVRHLHMILHKAFDAAVRLGAMSRNVCDFADAPTMTVATYTTLSVVQTQALLQSAVGSPYEALIVVAVTTGMRMGEILGLGWDTVHLDKGQITVVRTLQWRGGGARMETPKSKTSRRTIHLTQLAIHTLTAHKANQARQRDDLSPHWDDTYQLVFTNSVGRPIHASYFSMTMWKPLLKKAGLPDMRFHDLRHTCATLLLQAGVHPKVVSEMLGHASIVITLQLYSHVTTAMHQSAAMTLDALLVPSVESAVKTAVTSPIRKEDTTN